MNTHNNCEFSEKVYEYMDGTLSAEDRARVLEHLEGCESCSELKREHEAFAALLDSVNEELPEGLHDRIMSNVRSEMRRDRFMRAIKRYAMPVAAAFVLALTVPAILRANDGTDIANSPATDEMCYALGDDVYAPADTESALGFSAEQDGRKYDVKEEAEDACATVDTKATMDNAPDATGAVTGAPGAPAPEEPALETESAHSDAAYYNYSVTQTFGGEGVVTCYVCPIFTVTADEYGALLRDFDGSVVQNDESGAVLKNSEKLRDALSKLTEVDGSTEKFDYVRINTK
jgi:Zn-finger protein